MNYYYTLSNNKDLLGDITSVNVYSNKDIHAGTTTQEPIATLSDEPVQKKKGTGFLNVDVRARMLRARNRKQLEMQLKKTLVTVEKLDNLVFSASIPALQIEDAEVFLRRHMQLKKSDKLIPIKNA